MCLAALAGNLKTTRAGLETNKNLFEEDGDHFGNGPFSWGCRKNFGIMKEWKNCSVASMLICYRVAMKENYYLENRKLGYGGCECWKINSSFTWKSA